MTRVFTAYLFLLCTQPLFAQSGDETECPYFSVSGADTTGLVFSLVSTSVDATVSGVIADVEVEQTYVNPGDSVIDATYVFPMSTRAAVYAMTMVVDGREIEAVIKRRAEAQDIFDTADSLGQTATLLEQERSNVFQMSLANVQPGDSLRVRMRYTELLTPEGGIYQFVFPSIVGPRFTFGNEDWVRNVGQTVVPLSETDLNFNVRINAGMTLTADNISHDAVFDYEGTSATTELTTNPGDDFIVSYTLDDNQIETGLLLFEDEEENFFLSMVQPARPDIPFESPEREYIFIIDVSGSMRGEPLDLSKDLIQQLLSDLRPVDKFNLLFFAGGSATLAPNSVFATPGNIQLAIQTIEELNAGGSTQLLPALERALAMDVEEKYSRIFTIFSDGYVTVEKEAFDLIRNNLDEANFFSFGIGNRVNRLIIEGIAYVGEGEPFVLTNDDDPQTMADAFRNYIERPVLNNIQVAFDGIDVYDVEPLTVPDVFAERPIIVYGKYYGDPQGTLTMTGDYADGQISSTLNFEDYTEGIEENVALKYLWARKRIRLMSDYGIASNETDTVSIEEEITLLGLKYNLVTDFTSFVAVDSNAIVGQAEEDSGEGGETTETDALSFGTSTQVNFLKVNGTVVNREEALQLELDGQEAYRQSSVGLRIVGADGRLYSERKLQAQELEQNISIPLAGNIPAGIYFVVLTVNGEVWATERFVVR